ncbi:L,D-transpeptidase family protein [Stieleria varia]|uniref:Putative L,D-transpeptidase YkuD n=1 Tax=Stieleria varia TaxID=2528005 RepID=A0A5C6AEF2_9BACT|nr:L,D-transpeptidase family protein [Stieleria varia]TWT98422.1 putative L,D-transpeptidase YkuD [Stieleria varia]
MQTLKTAAIVVLLLTVMYSGYVSLTTPPEPLSDEVEALVIDSDLGITSDPMMPSLGDSMLGPMDTGSVSSNSMGTSGPSINAGQSQLDGPQFGGPEFNAPLTDSAIESGGTGATVYPPVASANNASPGMNVSQPSGNSFEIPQINTSLASSRQGSPSLLPAVTNPGQVNAPASMESYPSTDTTFQLPEPGTASGGFDPNRGTAFNPNSANTASSTVYSLNDQATDNRAASGQVKTNSFAQEPPTSAYGVGNTGLPAAENRGLSNAILVADQMYEKDQLKEALATLSVFYNTPNVSEQQRNELLNRLDPLARDVIYSKRHLLEQPYRMTSTETLTQVANRFGVPWQLLANINGIVDPVTILPGTELKVVRGPFRAEVDLARNELTLFLGDLYAGRFPIAVGNDPAPTEGIYTVRDKQESRTYYDRLGAAVPPGNPENPYGNVWMDLGGQLCIHGSPNTMQPTTKGCISLAGDLASDLYGIVSQGSSVTIRR